MLATPLLGVTLLTSEPAKAQEYPWCARYDWTTSNCGFVSFQEASPVGSPRRFDFAVPA
jgi:hypothetical protein